jgi:GAF domain-containing protein
VLGAYVESGAFRRQTRGERACAGLRAGVILESGALEKIVKPRKKTTRRAKRTRKHFGLSALAREQAALNMIAKAIGQSLRRDELLETALDKVLEITGRERGTIRLKDPVSGEVKLSAHRGFSEEEITELLRYVPHRISEEIFASGQPVVVNDRAELRNPQSLLPQSRSVAWIPIEARQKVVGVLGISSGRPIPFSRREVDLLLAVGSVIGVAVENARLFEESQRQEEIQRLLKELSQDITTLDINSLFHKVTDKVREFFKVDISDIRLLTEERLQLPMGSSGIESGRLYRSGAVRLRGRSMWILKNHRPLVISDTTKETAIPSGDSIRQLGIRGYLAVPLFSRSGEVIGILRALTYEPRSFSQSEVDLLQQLANGTAIALANARLFEETGRRARELAALHAVTAAVSGSFDLDQILLKGLDAVLEVTGMGVGYIQFLEGDPPRLLLKAHRGLSDAFVARFRGRVRPGGKTEQIIATRQPVVLENIPADHVGKFQGESVTAAAWVPITSKDQVIGVLTISSKTRPTFPLFHLPLLSSIGNTLGVALENARLFEETKQRAHEQAVLSAVAMAMSESLNLDELLQIALDRVLDATGREQGYIRLKNPVTGNLKLAAHRGVSENFLQTLLHERTPGGKSDLVFESGEPLVINDPEAFLLKEQTRREGNRSFVWIPLKMGGKTVGIMNVSTNRPLPFQPREVELLKALGNVIGVALENARLFNETERTLERIRALREIDQAITTSLDLRTILAVLMEKIDLVLPYAAATVRLHDRATGLLEPIACRNLDENEWKEAQWRGGRGIANVVFENRAPLIIRNSQADARVLDAAFYRKHSLTSYVGVPLRVKDEVLGVFGFYTREEHEFTGEEVEFLMTLAGQAAIAIHKSQLYEEARARERDMQETNRMLAALHAVAAAASQSLDLDRVVRAAIEKITEIFAFDATQIHVYDDRADELVMRAYFERNPQLFVLVRAFKLGEGIVGKVAESGRPLIFEDVLADPLYRQTSRTKTTGQYGYRFFAVFPIKGKLKSLGTLACTGVDARQLNAGEVQLLEAMADQIAVAIENTGLYEKLTQKVDELQYKTEELQRANKVKDEFLSVMSHELRTPLNVVMGYTTMIKDQLVGAVNPEQSQILEKLMSRVRSQVAMVNSILQATEIQAASVSLEEEEVALKDLLDGLRSDYSAHLSKSLTLTWDYPADLPSIRSDGKKLKQILTNLVDNAVKFTAAGRITVAASVSRRPATGRQCLELRVADTGRGISAAALPVIFEKFRQGDSSETRPYGGVGLGLYIAKNFAELLGGTIGVETGEGKGSIFTVTIPCAVSVPAPERREEAKRVRSA